MKSRTWRIRSWSIRAKIITLIMPPLLSLVVLWIFATSLTASPAFTLLDAQKTYELAGKPTEVAVVELQKERTASMAYLGSTLKDPRPLQDQRAATDKVINEFRRLAGTDDMRAALAGESGDRLQDALVGLDALAAGRMKITSGQLDRPATMALFAAPIDAIYRMYNVLPGFSDPHFTKDARTAIGMSRARELLAREDALLTAAAAAGRFAGDESTELVQQIGARRFMHAEVSVELRPEDLVTYNAIVAGDAFTQLRSLEAKIMSDAKPNGPVPVNMSVWRAAYDETARQLRDLDMQTGAGILKRSQPAGVSVFLQLAFAAVLGLLAVAVSIVLSVRIGRSLIRRLTGLRYDAQNLADERLPDLVGRLRHGEEIDIAEATPPLEYGTDEIGKVGHAFSAVQRTAVQSAVDEAQLRRGLNEVFLNIARRSQTLLHRQLALLDRMERRTSDPEELEDLFRVDHLATRMRRHAEDLVILAGAAPGRGWRNPVPMVDVIRGAVSEVEDYARVGFQSLPEASLIGRAVADVIHLLAEVIENATSYSPPHTSVQISGQLVPNGFAIEIEDRGLGMAPDAIDEANTRLLHPPDFDPANSARLGLFVVALLANRHGVRVTLRSSPYGGVTAVVLIPPHLITGASAELTAPTSAEQLQADVYGEDGPLALDAADVVRPTIVGLGAVPKVKHAIEAPVPIVPAPAPPPSAVPAAAWAPVPEPLLSSARAKVTDDGLPRRHRQASLAPQLREPIDEETTIDGLPASSLAMAGGARSPEQVREMMSSLQAGFTRGRRDAAQVEGTSDGSMDPHGPMERDV